MVPIRFLVAAVVAAAAVGCSSSSQSASTIPFSEPEPEIAPTVPATLITEPTVTLGPGEGDLVTVHASWLCELQRRTFADQRDIELALAAHLERSGYSATAYERFVTELASSQDLRDAVLYQYQKACLRD